MIQSPVKRRLHLGRGSVIQTLGKPRRAEMQSDETDPIARHPRDKNRLSAGHCCPLLLLSAHFELGDAERPYSFQKPQPAWLPEAFEYPQVRFGV